MKELFKNIIAVIMAAIARPVYQAALISMGEPCKGDADPRLEFYQRHSALTCGLRVSRAIYDVAEQMPVRVTLAERLGQLLQGNERDAFVRVVAISRGTH